jgi:LacI family transcriptional regulator
MSTRAGDNAAILQGIAQYMTENQSWDLLTRIWIGLPYLRSIKECDADGLIYVGSETPQRDRREMAEMDIPIVYAATYPDGPRAPGVAMDEAAVGAMAAEHLLSAGLRHFGYFGEEGHEDAPDHPMNVRQRGFVEAVEKAGGTCSAYFEPGPWCAQGAWDGFQKRLARWIRSLSKPVGIGVYSDPRAAFLIYSCRRFGILIPETVAVVAVGNERIVCDSVYPPLSSVDLGLTRVGFRAAQMLHGMLRGRRPPARPVLLGPLAVVRRRSSDIEAIDDPVVRACLDFVHEHMPVGVTVGDLLTHVMISQRSLEQRFRKALGRTPAAEIRRMQVEEAKRQLREGDLTVGEAAARCGFASQTRFSVTFKREVGQTASDYRRETRDHAPRNGQAAPTR